MSKYLICIAIFLLFFSSINGGSEAHDHSHDHPNVHTHSHDHSHSHSHSHSHKPVISIPDPTILGGPWAWTFASTTIIGIAPIIVIVFVPIMETVNGVSKPKVWLLKRLLGFAVGGLLGDVFLHLLPHASGGGHSHSHEDEGMSMPHDHSESTIQGLWILGGIIAFFLIEKYLRISAESQGHSHSHSHAHDDKKKDEKKNEKKKEKKEANNEKSEEQKKATAILNIVADMAHNFTDGMAIAGSFLVSYKLGMTTTFAVFIHEIPHEIGDYAILLQSGYEKTQAMKIQFYTAAGALLGALFGLITGGVADSLVTSFILPFTAGGFIYVACVNVIPELLETNSWSQTFWEVVAMSLGISLMVGIGQLENTELF